MERSDPRPFDRSTPGVGGCIQTKSEIVKIVEFAFIVYPASDQARSRAFYEGVLGLKPATTIDIPDGFWVEYEIGPHTLAVGQEPFLKPCGDGAQLVLEVEDFDDTIAHR